MEMTRSLSERCTPKAHGREIIQQFSQFARHAITVIPDIRRGRARGKFHAIEKAGNNLERGKKDSFESPSRLSADWFSPGDKRESELTRLLESRIEFS